MSSDQNLIVIKAKKSIDFSNRSLFKDVEEASDFFKNGSIGFSPNKRDFDGMELQALSWKVNPLYVSSVQSTFFENEKQFPKGSISFDNALLMQNIEHRWKSYSEKPGS